MVRWACSRSNQAWIFNLNISGSDLVNICEFKRKFLHIPVWTLNFKIQNWMDTQYSFSYTFFSSMYICLLMFIPLAVLIVFIGLALHAVYDKCDPLVAKKISKGDQVRASIPSISRTFVMSQCIELSIQIISMSYRYRDYWIVISTHH